MPFNLWELPHNHKECAGMSSCQHRLHFLHDPLCLDGISENSGW